MNFWQVGDRHLEADPGQLRSTAMPSDFEDDQPRVMIETATWKLRQAG
jgi:hypothetical protein